MVCEMRIGAPVARLVRYKTDKGLTAGAFHVNLPFWYCNSGNTELAPILAAVAHQTTKIWIFSGYALPFIASFPPLKYFEA